MKFPDLSDNKTLMQITMGGVLSIVAVGIIIFFIKSLINLNLNQCELTDLRLGENVKYSSADLCVSSIEVETSSYRSAGSTVDIQLKPKGECL